MCYSNVLVLSSNYYKVNFPDLKMGFEKVEIFLERQNNKLQKP